MTVRSRRLGGSLALPCLLVAAACAVGGEAAWRVVQGTFRIEDSRLIVEAAPAVAVLAGQRVADFVLEVDFVRPSKGQVAVSFRRQHPTAPWADAYYLNSLRPGHLRLGRKRGGRYDAPLVDRSHLGPLTAGATVRLRLWARGDHFRVWLDGQLAANVRDEQPFAAGGIALHVGTGGTDPPAQFSNLRLLGVDAVAPPKPDEIPPLGLKGVVEMAERTLQSEIPAIRTRLADAARGGPALDDAALQRLAQQAHGLLWRHFYDPATHMVYTILEPHSGKPVFPTRDEVLACIPNANGWSTPIEDCAGYGNGKHLAWLVERFEVTRAAEHAAQARAVLAGALHLGEIRPADATGFGEVVRGVLPDNRTYYVGKGPGSSGDNYNGYSYGLWRCVRSTLATDAEKRRIAAALGRTCYRRGAAAFVAIAADATGKSDWQKQYEARRKGAARSHGGWTAAERVKAASWTAVQHQVRLDALRSIEQDPLTRRAYAHAMRANAWSRWKDIQAGLDYDEKLDDYMHRVTTVRNPMDAMLTVALTGDRELIEAFLPAIRRVLGRYDFAAFRDQRQLTPYLGFYWLAVRHGALRHDPQLPPLPEAKLRLKPLDPKRNLVVTYFASCNPPSPGGQPFRFPRTEPPPK